MLKKEVSLDTPLTSRRPTYSSLFSLLSSSNWLQGLTGLYSDLLGERITPVQTLHLLHVQTAFAVLLLPVDISLPLRFILLLWTIVAALSCANQWNRRR